MSFISSNIILLFFKNMFRGRDVRLKDQVFPLKKTAGLRSYKVGNLLFIEQNPKKATPWAKLAQKGRRVMWVIDVPKNKYLVRVVEGKITRLS